MDSSDSSYYSRQQLDELFLQMIAFFSGDPKRIQHFMKVHSLDGVTESCRSRKDRLWHRECFPMWELKII